MSKLPESILKAKSLIPSQLLMPLLVFVSLNEKHMNCMIVYTRISDPECVCGCGCVRACVNGQGVGMCVCGGGGCTWGKQMAECVRECRFYSMCATYPVILSPLLQLDRLFRLCANTACRFQS